MLIASVQALASIPTSDDTLLPSPFDPRLDPALSPAVAEAARLDPGEADGSLSPTRCERDPLGDVDVPVERLFGAQTQRAVHNFPLSGITIGTLPEIGRAHVCTPVTNAPLRIR